MAPQVGLEPTTDRLTADCSTTELLRNNIIVTPLCLMTNIHYNKNKFFFNTFFKKYFFAVRQQLLYSTILRIFVNVFS